MEVTDEMLKVARSMQSFELMIKRIIELHEQSKPKPEPVKPDVYSNDGGEYWVQHPADCDIFSDWDDEPKVGDEYELQVCWTGKQKFRITEVEDGSVEKVELIDSNTTYYTTPPTREPLSEDFLLRLADECTTQFFNGVHQNATIHFARAVEQAHGIGV